MKGKFRTTKEETFEPTAYTYDAFETALINHPLKSPSPDKKSANIIVSTRSPDIHQLKRNATPTRQEQTHKTSHRSELREKHFQLIATPSYRKEATYKNVEPTGFKNADTGTSRREDKSGGEHRPSSPTNSRSRNIKIEIAADEEQEVRHSASRYRTEFRGELSELDYLRILKAKEEAISELKDYINALEARPDDTVVRNYETRLANCNSEIRQLKIENQYLFNAIEKEKGKGTSNAREEILQREIRELKESLRAKEAESDDLAAMARKLQKEKQDRKAVQAENESLIRLLKEQRGREQEDRKEESLSHSALSQQGRSNSEKERLSLVKIKQLHQQNLKIAQDSFYSQVRNIEDGFFVQLDTLNSRVDELNDKLARLQAFKRQAQSRIQQKQKGLAAREEAHKEKERHQEIETVLLEKYSYYERQIQEQKKENEKLTLQLNTAHKNIEELQLKSLTYSRDISYLSNHDEQELVESLHKQNEEQAITISRLQKEIDDTKQLLKTVSDEKEEISRIGDNKLELILEEYESKIKLERAEHQQLQAELRQEIQAREEREREVLDQQERDKVQIELQIKDALNLYDKENNGLKQSLFQKNNEIILLNEQLERVKTEFYQLKQADKKDSQQLTALSQDNDQLRNKCLALQKNVELLTQQLEEVNSSTEREKQLSDRALQDHAVRLKELERLNQSLKSYVAGLQDEREKLQRALKLAQGKIVQNEQAQVEVLGRFRAELDDKEQQNVALKLQLQQSQQRTGKVEKEKAEVQRLLQALRTERKSLHYETIEEELKQLRQMITDYYTKNKNRLDNEIVEDHFRLIHTHELKIDENLKLAQEIDDLKGQLAADGREKLLLSQKISLLESNIAIYERELRERRQLYEQVLQEKIRIEKEVLLSKRIKAEQSNLVEGFKSSTTDITSKIDRLVDFERERYRQIRALVEERIDLS